MVRPPVSPGPDHPARLRPRATFRDRFFLHTRTPERDLGAELRETTIRTCERTAVARPAGVGEQGPDPGRRVVRRAARDRDRHPLPVRFSTSPAAPAAFHTARPARWHRVPIGAGPAVDAPAFAGTDPAIRPPTSSPRSASVRNGRRPGRRRTVKSRAVPMPAISAPGRVDGVRIWGMPPPRPPIRRVRFELRPWADDVTLARELLPYVDDVSLVDLVSGYEQAAGFDVPGAYAGLVLENVSLGDLAAYLIGEPEAAYRANHGTIALLGCDCGELGCWPLEARVLGQAGLVTWRGFTQPHRRQRDYGDFGPFLFERKQYEHAARQAADLASESN